MSSQYPLQDMSQHRRVKSSVLPNFSFIHKRTASNGDGLSGNLPKDFLAHPNFESIPPLPADHPHSRSRALTELKHDHQSPPPLPADSREGQREGSGEDGKTLNKRPKSTISLKNLAKKQTSDVSKPKDSKVSKPKKTKSSTNLASLLSRPKSSKNLKKDAAEQDAREQKDADAQKDKENKLPTSQASAEASRPPIYAQFSSEYFTKQPLGGKFLEDEIDRYTPQDYSPGKQRNFYSGQGTQPTLGKRDEAPPSRPRSTYLPSSFSIQDISRKVSDSSRHSAEILRRVSLNRQSLERKTSVSSAKPDKTPAAKTELNIGGMGKRVMTAVSLSFGKQPKTVAEETEKVLNDKDIDKEFEAMLDRRNIPEHQRGKMRSLALSMKKDFIKQDWAEAAASKSGRPGTTTSDSSADATTGTHDVPEVKTKRARSRTFTLSRASNKEATSPTKKSRPESTFGKRSRSQSQESITGGARSLTSSGAAVAQTLIAKAKGQAADDFVSYLRKVQKPEAVEVGRLHKLRLLLRNETVAWTDAFIGQGGMEEIVGLLHRTLEVEWREEHEDALLHEVLLCLKALSTTALALQHLEDMQKTLFPALLHMIFDEEKKGPSEFTTRNIVTWLLFTYLKSAPLSERTHRAHTLLSYLKDPEPTESQRPVEFVLDMRRPRPYRVWNKEVVNVTKEVFWIFLHNLNVIAMPGTRGAEAAEAQEKAEAAMNSAFSRRDFDIENPFHVYMMKHFPKERPPVPAAPYVGGVEWDATNYLASHLELVNGILACLPTQDDRNALREQMLASGWEKCMGGTLRLCKEKFYGAVHAGLRCWVAAAVEDGWDTRNVRCGPSSEKSSPVKRSPKKAPVEEAPRIDMKLDFLGNANANANAEKEKRVVKDSWL